MQRTLTTLILAGALAACGGGEQEAADGEQAPAMDAASDGMAMTMPDWMQVDHDARTVTLDIVAGQTTDNNNWNFNGLYGGDATITVPAGYEVTINFRNQDPAIAHSLGISSQVGSYPPMFRDPQPVFAGAMTSNPTDAQASTRPGGSETITFTAATAGEYAMVCYVPAHATAGMWIRFTVAEGQEAGVSGT